MSSLDSGVTYTSISLVDVPLWDIRFFGMEQPDSSEAAPHHYLLLFHLLLSRQDGRDDGDDDDGDSFGDDTDGEDEEEEEEEHLALTDSAVVVHAIELVAPPKGTEPVIPPPSIDIATTGARITVWLQASISLPSEVEVERLLAMPTPPPSPLTSLSPHSVRERLARCTAPSAHLSPPPMSSPLLPSSGCPTYIQTLRMASTQAFIDAVTVALPSPPLPPPLYIPLPIDRRDDIPKTEMPSCKRSCLFTLSSRDTWVDPAEAVPELAPITLGEVNTRNTELTELHEHDTQDLFALLEDAQDSRTCISQQFTTDSQRVDLLIEDRIAHQETILIMEENAYAAREAWAHSIKLSQVVHSELQTHHEQVQIMEPVIRQGPNSPHNETDPNSMTSESVQAMIDQSLLRNSTNGDRIHSSQGDNRRNVQTARPCFYDDFMKCQPLNFKGTKGVVGLTRWFEKIESVFQISGCAIENQEVLKKKMTKKYCPQGEIKKLEIELWNLKVKGNDVPTYIERFQELTLICTKFVVNETEKIDKYISGLPDNIFGSIKSSEPKTLDETIELANDFMDQKLHTFAERQTENKRKAGDSSRNNHGHQQQPFKRKNVAKVYNIGTGEKKPYSGYFPKSSGNTNVANTQKGNGANPKGNGCFECGAPVHFKRDCPKLKNKDGGNVNAQGWVYVVGNAKKKGNASSDPNSNVVTGTFLLNNHYASILFNTGADRSFISIVFSSLIDIVPTPLGNSYDVELADGKIVGVDTIMQGCTLNFLNHPFNIYLRLVELGSFDVIIGMDWLRRCHAVIVCDEKLVRIPYGNETLIFCGDKSNDERESRLTIISCSKAQEYMANGCQIFLAQISAKKEEDKSEGKQLKDVPTIQDFLKLFPEDLPGLPPARPVEFQIDLIPGAALVARAPYQLASSEMKELSEQLQELSDKGFIRPSSSPWGAPVLFVKKKDGSFRMCIDYH
nr:hypothetical protein [Tanacetum cinerariifolium]